MLTILAIEESLMREIGDFEPLLQNSAKAGEYKICSWRREGKTLEESIPALFDREYISEAELLNWNIMVVSDDRTVFVDNPFEGSYFPGEGKELADRELNEIAKMLGVVPAHSKVKRIESDDKSVPPRTEISIDSDLQDQKLSEYKFNDFARPEKIYLLAVQKKYDIDMTQKHIAGAQTDSNNSFCRDGYYPANCRFLKFNLSSNSNKTTMVDYFRMWMTILALVYNDGAEDLYIPPYSLYSVDADIDNDKVRIQINDIYSRIRFVRKYAENQIENIHQLRKSQAAKHYDMPNLNSSIEVNFQADESNLYLDERQFGLAKDCPIPDEPEYKYQRDIQERNIKEYLKVPARAVRKCVGQTKEQGVFVSNSPEIIHLNREQTEDLNESIDQLEIELMRADEIDISYPNENARERSETDSDLLITMEKRSTVSAIVLGSLVMFAAFVFTFLPYIINAITNVKTKAAVSSSILVTVIVLLAMALCGIITLVILRHPLTRGFRRFEETIDDLVDYVNNQSEAYSKYLSKLSEFMKRNSFKRYLESDHNSYKREEEDLYILNRNYCFEIESTCSKWAESFRFNLMYSENKASEYSFELDESPQMNPVYAFVVSDGVYNIDFNAGASQLESPYAFIKSLNIQREEGLKCR